ncbi:hypothetical protein AB4084_38955, partial [Lysobacter sp. 2RAB21]
MLTRFKAWITARSGRRLPSAESSVPEPREPFPNYYLYAYCDPWPSKQDMLRILQADGLEVEERPYAVQAW